MKPGSFLLNELARVIIFFTKLAGSYWGKEKNRTITYGGIFLPSLVG